jgi:hypothetical protein
MFHSSRACRYDCGEVRRMRSMPRPVGAGRMRAPLALGANGGCAVRHRRDDANILLRDSRVNAIRETITRTTIALRARHVPRAGVVNARRPGPRPGRSEAKSIDDTEHGASIEDSMVSGANTDSPTATFFRERWKRGQARSPTRSRTAFSGRTRTCTRARGRRVRPARAEDA